MSDKNNTYEVTPFEKHARELVTDPEAEPIVLNDVIRELGIGGIPVAARDLVGETFIITRAKQFKSSFDGVGRDPWFCIIRRTGDPDPYQVVIGGGACTEILEAFANAEEARPLQVTLQWHEGGNFSGYYTFE